MFLISMIVFFFFSRIRRRKRNSNRRRTTTITITKITPKRTKRTDYPNNFMFHKPRLCVICESIRPVKHIAPTSLPLLGAKIMTNHLNFPKDKSKSLKTICILTKRMKFSKKRMYLVHIPISLRFLFCNRRRRSVNPPLCL